MDIERARVEVNNAHWVHSFEVLPGVVTPGRWPTDAKYNFDLRYKLLPQDLSGLRALDIGALDGPYSFELESRGASVVSLDIQHPDRSGFNTAKRVRGSRAEYVQGDAYELDKLVTGKFDIITFLGVWYHMKNPELAFEKISSVLADGGLVLLEGECLRNYVEINGEGQRAPVDVVESELGYSIFYPNGYKQSKDNWMVPNLACVKGWLSACGMELAEHGFWDDYPHQRLFGTARKKSGFNILPDNPVW